MYLFADDITPMEAFILALLKSGINTMYLLGVKAALSPGGIRPIIARMENNRLLRKSKEGKRNKRVLQITDKGCRVLAAAFADTEHTTSWDLDSAVRVLWSSASVNHERGVRLLNLIIDQRKEQAADLESSAERLSQKTADPLSLYLWMRAHSKARQLKAEAQAIEDLGKEIRSAQTPEARPEPREIQVALGEDSLRHVRD